MAYLFRCLLERHSERYGGHLVYRGRDCRDGRCETVGTRDGYSQCYAYQHPKLQYLPPFRPLLLRNRSSHLGILGLLAFADRTALFESHRKPMAHSELDWLVVLWVPRLLCCAQRRYQGRLKGLLFSGRHEGYGHPPKISNQHSTPFS